SRLEKHTATPQPEGDVKQSIILLIGDGMGYEAIEFGRLIEYGPDGNSSLLEFPYQTSIATLNTYGQITDSAEAATAIATGQKTGNSRISTTLNDENLTTILEIAEENGYNTGIVATCKIVHATPAAFMAHTNHRNNYLEIAADISKQNVETLLGGGHSSTYLGNYIPTMEALGYNYFTNRTSLMESSALPQLGLFAASDLTKVMNREEDSMQPRLLEMTQKSIELLSSSDKPYFLMIEGSQIDWACHNNDAIYLAHEMIEFEKTVAYVKSIAENDPSLQVIVTADHETGGFDVQYTMLETEMPLESDDFETKKQKRTDRSQEISFYFSSTDHTSREVILTGMGPNAENIENATHLVDVFDIMNSTIIPYTAPIQTNSTDSDTGTSEPDIDRVIPGYSIEFIGTCFGLTSLICVFWMKKKSKLAVI
ncbi:MAG: alkaline phosphatase, partial [Candidatus Heimdallarchaeota archaeon]|nr:alkaline phosphatase [Candidatus Heimdallarchaeota archaeon]